MQSAIAPPFSPLHVQFHGPMPATALGVPEMHNPWDGAVVTPTPCAGPHAALSNTGAPQLTDAPPFSPLQFQFHGPLPVTTLAVPDAHNAVVGVDDAPTPLASPHAPSFKIGAEQLTVVFSPEPVQLQLHGPSPMTAVSCPDLQRPDVGAALTATPFAGPHAPLTNVYTTHCAVTPPLSPKQLQYHGPLPVMLVALPDAHNLLGGGDAESDPFAGPHSPLI